MANINITPEELAKSAAKFSKDLIAMPIIGLESTLKHMNMRKGIRYEETTGELTGDVELAPYSEKKSEESNFSIDGRKIRTYFGSVWIDFSPNSVYKSIYGSSIVLGEELKNVPVTKMVLAYMMNKIGQSLNRNIWRAVRNENGKKTIDLFDGFDTITANEITANKISVAKRNLFEFTDPISDLNAVDLLKAFYRSAADELRETETNTPKKLFVPFSIYDAYVDDYQKTVGAAPYNKEFEKTFLEGTSRQVELVPLFNKNGSDFIHLSTKENMVIGVDQESSLEHVIVEKHSPYLLDLVAAMFFGAQFRSISPERLLVGKLAPVADAGDDGDDEGEY